MPVAKFDGEWVRCASCGHKLARKIGAFDSMKYFPALEIKCSSCGEINYVMFGKAEEDGEKDRDD